MRIFSVAVLLLLAVGQANADTLRYTLKGDYGTDLATSEYVRGGSFRVFGDFDAGAAPTGSTATSATYSNSEVRVQTLGTAQDLDLVVAAPILFLLTETSPNDTLTAQVIVPADLFPATTPGFFTPVLTVSAFAMAFFDESIVSGDPIGLPIFTDANSAISFFPTIANVDTSSVTFRVEIVPEPAGIALLGWGLLTVAVLGMRLARTGRTLAGA